ncbi:MAG TPA: glycosyltransferase family 2 protein, partial [Thermomicrobiales bacterium]|nr:glycosyltransferase family 2 protein [Thermomicrobiales bacterium]
MAAQWTAIIVNYNGAGFIEACVAALEASTPPPAEIIVVDNGSSDDSLLEMHAFPRVQVLPQGRNLGFAGGANVGINAVETKYAVILNPDVEVDPSFGRTVEHAFGSNPRLGAAGPLLLYPDGELIQHAGGHIERPLLTTAHHHYGEQLEDAAFRERNVDFVTGGAMALRMDAVREAGGFDEELSPVYYEDVDLCVRLAKLHWEVKFIPEIRALHHEGVTLQREPAYYSFLHRNRISFALKHLSPDEWSTSFVPAEIERLRAELHHAGHQDWLTVSGANAIEGLLRSRVEWSPAPALLPERFDAARKTLEEARTSWDVPIRPPGARRPLVGPLMRFVHALGPRQFLDAA